MKRRITTAALLLAAMVSPTFAAETATAPASKKGAKPAASPGWVVFEEDWWIPHSYAFLDSVHQATVHARAQEEKAASAEIDKAANWLKYAASHADMSTKEDLTTARADLMDFSMDLKAGKPVNAKKLQMAFANASAALAKHHHFKSSKAVAEGDLKTAGRHLMLAVDHVREAARQANHAYGDDIVGIYDSYAPYGYWDETIVLEKNEVESNLGVVKSELQKLATEMKTAK